MQRLLTSYVHWEVLGVGPELSCLAPTCVCVSEVEQASSGGSDTLAVDCFLPACEGFTLELLLEGVGALGFL